MIVGLSGKKRVGKDVCASILVNRYKFNKLAFADPLRDLCSKVFNIELSIFLSDDLKEKQFERPVALTVEELGHIEAIVENEWGFNISEEIHRNICLHEGVTFGNPRQILQYIGTDLVRQEIDDAVWLKLAEKKIEKIGGNIVFSDVRFKNERDFIKSKSGTLCLIKRPTLQIPTDTHKSENDLDDDSIYDIVITNDDTLSRFQIEVDSYFSYLLRSKR